MKIVIDGRFYGLKNTGIGRYLMNLLSCLGKIDKENEYWVLLNKEGWEEFDLPGEKWHKVRTDVPHYSLREQIVLPIKLGKIKPDVLHVPHFNAPIFWQGKLVVTIHDLLWHEWKGESVTTLAPFLYWVKYAGFKLVFSSAVKKAKRILVPSNWVKENLEKRFGGVEKKTVVTYEGVDERLRAGDLEHRVDLGKYGLEERKYLLYVGNVYPHKNVVTLVKALAFLPEDLKLAVVCGRDLFRERLELIARKEGLWERVKWLGYVPDEELRGLYEKAAVFVFPSLSEGFGLPGLEAMACGVPVVAARSSSLPEVLGEAAIYFEPKDAEHLASRVREMLSDKVLRRKLIESGRKRASEFSWKRMAEQTLGVYKEVIGGGE